MRTGLLAYNPVSGNHIINNILDDVLAYAQDRDLSLVPLRLHPFPDCIALLHKMMVAPWVDLIVASGGDGTIAMVAQAILAHRPGLPLGIIPSGTCNDFAESLRLPQEIWDCINVVAEGNLAALDIGRVNDGRIFLSTCAGGVFVNLSYTVSSAMKKNLGPLAYYFSALRELANIRPFPLRIETETETIEDSYLLFLLINGSHAAGWPNLYPKARMWDGYMDLLLLREVPPLDFPQLLVEIFNRENSEDGRWLKRLKAKQFHFSSAQDIPTALDGEEGLPLPLDVEVIPRALSVYVRQEES